MGNVVLLSHFRGDGLGNHACHVFQSPAEEVHYTAEGSSDPDGRGFNKKYKTQGICAKLKDEAVPDDGI